MGQRFHDSRSISGVGLSGNLKARASHDRKARAGHVVNATEIPIVYCRRVRIVLA